MDFNDRIFWGWCVAPAPPPPLSDDLLQTITACVTQISQTIGYCPKAAQFFVLKLSFIEKAMLSNLAVSSSSRLFVSGLPWRWSIKDLWASGEEFECAWELVCLCGERGCAFASVWVVCVCGMWVKWGRQNERKWTSSISWVLHSLNSLISNSHMMILSLFLTNT